MLWAARALLLFLAASAAADDSDLLSHIRAHMREYLARLPDYTCRVTIERAQRPNSRSRFEVTDRLRLDIAYASGHEYYAWPGDAKFQKSIDELLPARGMVSEGSWALHMRKLFLTNDAEFDPPRRDEGSVRTDFLVPAVRSGFAVSAGGASAPAALRGSVWFAPDSLDVRRLEVRVEQLPPRVRIAWTREVTHYRESLVADVPSVLPAESELVLRDRDGSERQNWSRFDDCHRFTGSATVRFEEMAPEQPKPAPPTAAYRPGQRVDAVFGNGIPTDVAVGDVLTAGDVKVRVTDVRQMGNKWLVEFSLIGGRALARKTLALPSPPRTSISFRVE